ncbi:hypothetical protein RHGRI_000613 [Rhododendron griersonianum]|uniref:F-box domain-containing protein n=1 Tax=Rhododendron griersonianum TaxID=479676 RepID=A0AAV6LK70_9ERIC|nr:hypothetical protein RHGRI_000613 [Rhododendron griersonianum]
MIVAAAAVVKRFRLKCSQSYDASLVNGWIAETLLRNVQELDLDFSIRMEYSTMLPQDLFTCRTLVVLKLKMAGDMNIVPTSVSLPSIRILHLGCYRFVDDDLINKFLFGCPVLEELSMSGSVGGNVSVINIVAPMLTSLFIHDCSHVGKWPRPHGIERKIVIDTPALLYLEIIDDASDSCYLVENLHHLIRADICLYAEDDSDISEALTDLLTGISNVQFLKLDFSIQVTCIPKMTIMRDCQLPKFPNMTCLELGKFFYVEWEFLLELLENSPRLETLVFKGGLGNDYEVFTQLLQNPARNVPSCLLSHLKANTMREVMGSNSRRQMLCEEEQYEDRISNLPDSLIAQILSCLPTKYAVATSVLSTRWKQLWTSITSLDFDDKLLLLPHNQTNNPTLHWIFTSFVCRVLSLHRGKCVQKFRLKCTCTCDVSHVNGWIADMLLRDVRELDLSVHVEHSILLPQELFTCRTLVVLKLDDIYDVTVMDVPTSVSLPNLKILHLVGIGFVDDDSISRFLFGCPVLEELRMTRCVREDVGVINVVAPVLTSLIISECLAEYTHGLECKIVLDTPALLYLTISDSPAEGYLVGNLCHLIRADIDFLEGRNDSTGSEGITNLLSGISGVQSLHLSNYSMEVISSGNSLLPKFHNMTYLELGAMPNDGWKLLPELLENSPHLGTLVFEKVIEIRFFEGEKEEWEMVEYFLCNAKVLEKVNMHYSDERDCTIQITQ